MPLARSLELALLQALQRLRGAAPEAPSGVGLEDLLEVAAGPGALAHGREGGGPVVVGDAESGVVFDRPVRGFEGAARVTGGVEARSEGGVVAGERAAGDELLVEAGGPLVLAPAEGHPGAALVRDHRPGHDGRENRGPRQV